MTALGNIQAGGRILASVVQGVAPLAVIKGADQTVTSSTTVVNDNALVLPVVANATYLFLCYLDYEGGTTGGSDLKWVWSVPSSGTLRYQRINFDPSNATQLSTLSGATTGTARTNGTNLQGVTMFGSLIMSSTAGNLQLQWAQNSPSSTGTIVHAQSYLALWRIS